MNVAIGRILYSSISNIMQAHKREIIVYYNPDIVFHKETVANARTLTDKVKAFTFENIANNTRQWEQILDLLEIQPREILDKNKPAYEEVVGDRDFDRMGWLTIIRKHPELLRGPIVISGDKGMVCTSSTQVHRLFQS